MFCRLACENDRIDLYLGKKAALHFIMRHMYRVWNTWREGYGEWKQDEALLFHSVGGWMHSVVGKGFRGLLFQTRKANHERKTLRHAVMAFKFNNKARAFRSWGGYLNAKANKSRGPHPSR